MAVNTMTFNQLATVLGAITAQATGKQAITATDTGTFVSVAKTALETGYDPLSTAISQVLSRTIFSVRPYSAKFKGLEVDNIQYGNMVRKINYVDTPFEEDDRIKLADGYSIDPYVVQKPKVVQTNFYGENVYQKHITIYKDQLDCAFSGPDEFQRFISGVMQNAADMLEQARENTARYTLANLIGGTIALDTNNVTNDQVIHLITEYNARTGDSITSSTCFNPSVFPDFAKFIYGRIKSLSKFFTERTVCNHLNLSSGDILRHTPVEDQRLYLLAPQMDQVGTNVLSTLFNEEYMRLIPYEEVNFWQSPDYPMGLKLYGAGYTAADGSATKADVDCNDVFGILMDRDAAGISITNEWSATTPFNPRGGYSNIFWHRTVKYVNDNTEKAVVLKLD